MFGLSFMSMAITPGSVIIFGFTTVPILIMSMLTMIRDAFIHFFPSIEYYSWSFYKALLIFSKKYTKPNFFVKIYQIYQMVKFYLRKHLT